MQTHGLANLQPPITVGIESTMLILTQLIEMHQNHTQVAQVPHKLQHVGRQNPSFRDSGLACSKLLRHLSPSTSVTSEWPTAHLNQHYMPNQICYESTTGTQKMATETALEPQKHTRSKLHLHSQPHNSTNSKHLNMIHSASNAAVNA